MSLHTINPQKPWRSRFVVSKDVAEFETEAQRDRYDASLSKSAEEGGYRWDQAPEPKDPRQDMIEKNQTMWQQPGEADAPTRSDAPADTTDAREKMLERNRSAWKDS